MRDFSKESALTRDVREAVVHRYMLDRLDQETNRYRQMGLAGEFGSVFANPVTQSTSSYASLIPAAWKESQQLELDLPGYNDRANIRRCLAHKIEAEVLPLDRRRWLERLPDKLRTARQEGCFGVRLETGERIVYWDHKAGLSRLCPDDAREEAMRLRRRVQPELERLQADGHQLTYAVFTLPNFQHGRLRAGMDAIFSRFKASILKARKDGALQFPQIKGALAVLEAPLGAARDWNVHLNVILVTRGFLDWKALRARWHWNVELRKLSSAPGAIGGALTELIKYAVAATVAKSMEHAEGGRTRAPAMLEWTGTELLEWLHAFHGFRRTRSYGALYGLEDPGPADVGPVAWLGVVKLEARGYVMRVALFDSIPEDKSHPGNPVAALAQLRRRLRPPDNPSYHRELPRTTQLYDGRS